MRSIGSVRDLGREGVARRRSGRETVGGTRGGDGLRGHTDSDEIHRLRAVSWTGGAWLDGTQVAEL
jgi:hypothetical protein